MIEFIEAPDHVAAFALSGTLTEEDLDKLIADVEARLDRHDRIGILADMTGFHDITVRAGLKDLRYGFGKFRDWKRFPKEAVITDRHWLATLVRAFAPFVPLVSVRSFQPEERETALAWVTDIEGKAAT
jgi:hypothetical protein